MAKTNTPEEYLKESTGPTFVDAWHEFTNAKELNQEEEFFCVHTWFKLPWSQMYSFNRATGDVFGQIKALDENKPIGYSAGSSPFMWKPELETISVWHKRSDMATFYKTKAHAKAMKQFGRDENPNNLFGVRRVLVKAKDLPKTRSEVREFIAKVKTDTFPNAPPPQAK